jgi:hypothetical protein
MVTIEYNIFSDHNEINTSNDYDWIQNIIWYIWISLYRMIKIECNMSYDFNGIDISFDYNGILYHMIPSKYTMSNMITIKFKLSWDYNSTEHDNFRFQYIIWIPLIKWYRMIHMDNFIPHITLYIICQMITIDWNLSKIYSMSTNE